MKSMRGANDTVGSAVSVFAEKKSLTKQKFVEFVILKYLSGAITYNSGSREALLVETRVNI